jgi:hypothetical protein
MSTECCALFRYFGVRAEVVDFVYRVAPPKEARKRRHGAGSAEAAQAGPPTAMGLALHSWFNHVYCEEVQREWAAWMQVTGLSQPEATAPTSSSGPGSCRERSGAAPTGPGVIDLTGSDEEDVASPAAPTTSGASGSGGIEGGIPASYVPPVYLQHQGHSRTIVGQRTATGSGSGVVGQPHGSTSLLILDPAHGGQTILDSLLASDPGSASVGANFFGSFRAAGWEKLLSSGLDSFRQEAYQVVYIAPGLLTAGERAASRNISSHLIKV